MKLLIVDDELWSRALIKNIIPWRDVGFTESYEASNGQEAINYLNKQPIDLMITDMRMPVLDGAALLKHVRNHHFGTEIIVMSGYEDYAYLHEALKTKAIDYLLKPVVKSELIKAVRRAKDIIHERQSYQHIEQILIDADLNLTLNKYYEVKNLAYKALINKDLARLSEQLDKLETILKSEAKPSLLTQYMHTDFNRFVSRLNQEYFPDQPVNEALSNLDFNTLEQQLMTIIAARIHIEVHKKIRILDVQRYIDTHFADAISLADVAEIYHVSKEHLSRLFKREVGISVQNYIKQKKIDHAKRLLSRHQKLSITTIGVMSGFLDTQYFYRVFRQETGVTPGQYRQNKSILST